MKLVHGSQVIIVGGGPAGCFTALHLLRFPASAGIHKPTRSIISAALGRAITPRRPA